MASDTTTLAPCPFCGGCAVHFHYSGSACVGCKDCIAYLGGEESDLKPDALAEAWNRRAPAPAPTDAEILDAAEDFRSQYTHGGTTFDEFDEIGFARAVLAKWGAPTPASGEAASPFGYFYIGPRGPLAGDT